MNELSVQTCEACRADAPKVSDDELASLMKEIPEWMGIAEKGILKLRREYTFTNFVDALAFCNTVGELAEEQGHHPDILTEWGKTTVTWWSHKIKGLHKNDFIMAAKCDQFYL